MVILQMYCEQCGREVADKSRYCKNCGTQIEGSGIEASEVSHDGESTVEGVSNR